MMLIVVIVGFALLYNRRLVIIYDIKLFLCSELNYQSLNSSDEKGNHEFFYVF
jgi:uridine kinase